MKTNNLKTALLLGATFLLALPALSWSQTAVTSPTTAPITSAPASVPTALPVTSPPAAAPVMPATPTAGVNPDAAGSDPAVTAVLDRLKQDTTPLSISDMSSAQDALARLNLMNEIEQKLSQIEETRAKRLGLEGMADLGGAGSLGAQQVFNDASGIGGSVSHRRSAPLEPQAKIQSISGASGRYNATVNFEGRQIIVKNGSFLPDGSRIARITATGVTISRNGKKSTLSFADADGAPLPATSSQTPTITTVSATQQPEPSPAPSAQH